MDGTSVKMKVQPWGHSSIGCLYKSQHMMLHDIPGFLGGDFLLASSQSKISALQVNLHATYRPFLDCSISQLLLHCNLKSPNSLDLQMAERHSKQSWGSQTEGLLGAMQNSYAKTLGDKQSLVELQAHIHKFIVTPSDASGPCS